MNKTIEMIIKGICLKHKEVINSIADNETLSYEEQENLLLVEEHEFSDTLLNATNRAV